MSPFPACLWSQGDGCGEGSCLGPHGHHWPICASPEPPAVLRSSVEHFFPWWLSLPWEGALGSWNAPSRSILHPGTSQDSYTVKFYLNSWVFSFLLSWFSDPMAFVGAEWGASLPSWGSGQSWCLGRSVLGLGSCSWKHGSIEHRRGLHVRGSGAQILYARLFIALLSLTDPWG